MMKLKLASAFIFTLSLSFSAIAQDEKPAEMPKLAPWGSMEWDSTAMTDKNMLPMFGFIPKTAQEKKDDAAFMQKVLEKDSTRQRASAHMMRLGYKMIHKDLKMAMYRFNHAYMFDSSNVDVFGGYAQIYTILGDYMKAKRFYEIGLAKDSTNIGLCKGMATYYLAHYFALQTSEPAEARKELANAIDWYQKVLAKRPKDASMMFKLSLCYLAKGDCKGATSYLNQCKAVNPKEIPADFEEKIDAQCKLKKMPGVE